MNSLGTLSWEATLVFSSLSPFSTGSTLRSKFFPLTLMLSEMPKLYTILAFLSAIGLNIHPTLEGFHTPGKQIGRHKSCFPLQIWGLVVLLFYVHGKHLRSCRDGQLT